MTDKTLWGWPAAGEGISVSSVLDIIIMQMVYINRKEELSVPSAIQLSP